MSSLTTQAIVGYLNQKPGASNDEVAEYVRRAVPGSRTTGASVSSVKSNLRKAGLMARKQYEPMSSEELENFMPTITNNGGLNVMPESDPEETIEEAKNRIAIRYEAMERMSHRIAAGQIPSLIISGPPGLGKSFTIKGALTKAFPDGPDKADSDGNDAYNYDIVSGSISAVGLYQALWRTKDGGILVLDDVDDVFRDETCLNLLKAALDSQATRTISWRKNANWLAENGMEDRFEFEGCVVFLTNIDFEQIIQSGKRDAEHFKALIDRSMYLCLTLRTRRDFMIRIRQVSAGPEGMLVKSFGLTEEQAEEVLDFVSDHQTKFYNLSLRLVGQIALCMKADPDQWQKDVEATKMKTI